MVVLPLQLRVETISRNPANCALPHQVVLPIDAATILSPAGGMSFLSQAPVNFPFQGQSSSPSWNWWQSGLFAPNYSVSKKREEHEDQKDP
jgi:hypothetical protein